MRTQTQTPKQFADWKPSGIFIPGNVPSLKNNKQIVTIGARMATVIFDDGERKRMRVGGRMQLVPSARHKAYHAEAGPYYQAHTGHWRTITRGSSAPYHVRYYFVRDSRRKFDYDNAITSVQDMMTEAQWIADDDCVTIIPGLQVNPDGLGYHVDKAAQGVWITVL